MEHNDTQSPTVEPVKTPSPVLDAAPATTPVEEDHQRQQQQQTTTSPTKPPRLDTTAARPAKKHRQLSAELPSASQILAEYHYLLGDLARQNARAVALLRTVDEKQAQLAVATSAAEARKLRKALGFAQSQYVAAEQQEHLVWMRLSDLCAQMQSRHRLAQIQSQRQQPQPSVVYPLSPPAATPHPTPVTATSNGPRVTFAEVSPIVRDNDDSAGPWADRIPLTPYATSFPSPFSSPFAPSPSSPSAPMPSPMSPLAPVFRPRSGFFADAGTAAAVAAAAAAAASEDQQSGPDSLDSVLAAVAEATQDSLEPGSEPGGGRTDEEDGGAAVYGDDEDSGAGDYMVASGDGPKRGPMRRASHSAAPRQQDKHKRMSLPVRLSWPEELQ